VTPLVICSTNCLMAGSPSPSHRHTAFAPSVLGKTVWSLSGAGTLSVLAAPQNFSGLEIV